MEKFVTSASERLTGQLVRNVELNSNVRQLKIKLGRHAPKYHAGDFYFLSFHHVAGLTSEAHPFSVTLAPVNSPNNVTFTIQNHGDFTNQLATVPVGRDVKLEGPFGRFAPIIEATQPDQPLVFIGMGTGIAPLLSLTQQYAATRKIHVLWSAHEVTDFYYREEFTQLVPQISYDSHVTRLTMSDYQKKLTGHEREAALFFIVGPANGVLGTKKILRQLGVKTAQLIDERLTM